MTTNEEHKEDCVCSECQLLKEIFKNFDTMGEIHSIAGIKTNICTNKCKHNKRGDNV